MKNKVRFLMVFAVIAVLLVGINVGASDKKIKMTVATQLPKTDIGWGQSIYEAYLYIKET